MIIHEKFGLLIIIEKTHIQLLIPNRITKYNNQMRIMQKEKKIILHIIIKVYLRFPLMDIH